MILKIERHDTKQHWWLWDNIKKISLSYLLTKSKPTAPKAISDNPGTDAILFDHEDEGPYYRLICRLNNNSEYSIAFDTIAYILNNNGKTIEKIVCNYKD